MKYSVIIFLLFFNFQLDAQSQIPLDMKTTLSNMNLDYLTPVEYSPTYITSGKIKYFDYDFGLYLDNDNTHVFVQTRRDDGQYIPQVMISALISTLATNDQNVEINMVSPNDQYLKDTNCDWAIEALFTPKENIGDYNIAYLKSIFKAGIGVTNILYLSKSEIEIQPLFKYKQNSNHEEK